ncbi:MAG: hypothetical protein JWQ58_3470 [Reyranella sp.]|nr:hypothetical protein [Reyranella sp.]
MTPWFLGCEYFQRDTARLFALGAAYSGKAQSPP